MDAIKNEMKWNSLNYARANTKDHGWQNPGNNEFAFQVTWESVGKIHNSRTKY